MARIPETAGDGEVAERIRARRPGGVLRPIDRVLLHSPKVADGWNSFLGAIRGGMTLRADLRELIILRIAVLNDAPYEWDSHHADALSAGLSADQMQALRRTDADEAIELDDLQRMVVGFTDAMTRGVVVPDALFVELLESLGTEATVELTITAAAYNMVSRLVVTLGVEPIHADPDFDSKAVRQ